MQIYKSFSDRVNVNIGPRHGNENFFTMNTWNYQPTVPKFDVSQGDCNASIGGSSEGAIYRQMIAKTDVLRYWRKSLCRPVDLYFEGEVQVGALKGYKFIQRQDSYDRFANKSADCYKGDDLPDGLTDVSKCYFGAYLNDCFCLKTLGLPENVPSKNIPPPKNPTLEKIPHRKISHRKISQIGKNLTSENTPPLKIPRWKKSHRKIFHQKFPPQKIISSKNIPIMKIPRLTNPTNN